MSRKRDGVRNQRIMPGLSMRGRYIPQEPATSTKVDRNAPCPCGSGRKYKVCCGSQRGHGIVRRVLDWLGGRR